MSHHQGGNTVDVQAEIRTWLLKQNDWLQEAADRLLKNGELGPADIAALVAILKTSSGQKPTKHRDFVELTNNPKAEDELRLVRIAEVVGIENLEPRVPLEFGSANLTVIYGHNGSGKSSYTRILKKVSGKPRAVDLKTNVFKAAPPHSKCSITSQLNGVESSHEWSVGVVASESRKSHSVHPPSNARLVRKQGAVSQTGNVKV